MSNRQKKHRQRQANGRGCLTIEVDLHRWSDLLIRNRLLSEQSCDDRAAIAQATARFIDVIIASDALVDAGAAVGHDALIAAILQLIGQDRS